MPNDDFSARIAAIRMQGPHILPSARWSSLYSTHGLDTDEKTARDVLDELHSLLTWMEEEGQTPRAVEKKFRQKFFDKGWARAFHAINSYSDEYSFYDAMVSPSLERLCHIEWVTYAAFDEWTRLVELAEDRPYWRYVALVDNRTHPAHKSWHGLILRAGDPWWATHFPPNSWGCRCKVMSVSEVDLEAEGWSVCEAPQDKLTEFVDPLTGKVLPLPEGIEPGWGTIPPTWNMEPTLPFKITPLLLASCLLSLEKEEYEVEEDEEEDE